MSRVRSIIAAVVVGLAGSGCASSPWSAGNSPPTDLSASSLDVQGTGTARPAAASVQADPQQLQNVMAGLQQLGTLDPVAQNRLLEDLRQTDPSLWPLVIEQFRATLAYRHRAKHDGASGACRDVAGRRRRGHGAGAATPGSVSAGLCPAGPSDAGVVRGASPGDWRQRLAGAIEAMEAETPQNPTTPAELAQQARLRMLYAAAGRREDAARPIPGAPPATQQFCREGARRAGRWLDVEQTPDAARRAAEAKPVLAEALAKLAESAPLTVRNLAFCTEVLSYGCAKRFDKYEFAPNQEVLLYAEVENFASEPTPKGYHTSLRSSYQILDARGQRVAEHTFAPTEEYCQNLRRDFFIGYHLRLPKQIGPGKYTLRLSIEDLKCRKTGQASIEFAGERDRRIRR